MSFLNQIYLFESLFFDDFGKFLITFLLSLLFGFERQKAHKPIGFGTFIFVSTGACGLAIIAVRLSPSNPLPLLSAIVTGIGFLGAGALIKTADKIHGFTSASLIWIFAIFGMMIGLSEIKLGVSIYIFVWIITIVDLYLENKGIGAYQKRVTIKTTEIVTLDKIEQYLERGEKIKLLSMEKNQETKKMAVCYYIGASNEDLQSMILAISLQKWFESYRIE